MKPIARSAALALIMTVAAVPATARADEPTGGTSLATASPTTTTGEASATPPAATTVSPTRTVSLTRSQTKRVQRKVHVRADGKLGRHTRHAIGRYQTRHDLTRTSRPNLETLRAMRLPFADAIERRLSTRAAKRSAEVPADLAPALAAARAWIGTPYRDGGTTTRGFDCSGLVVRAFRRAGIDLPRTSFEQYREGTAVPREAIQPGDLVFFSTAGRGASHVGIATSATTVISATTTGVREHRIDDDYWGGHYVGTRRISAV